MSAALPDPPGPTPWDLLRDARRLMHDPLPVWQEWRRDYGDLVRVEVAGQRFYLAFHPRQVEQVLKLRAENYVRETPAAQVLRLIQGLGLATVTGERWRRRRKQLAPWFFGRAVDGYAPLMMEMIEDYLRDWEGPAARGEALDLRREMVSLAIRIGSSTLVSTDLKAHLSELEGLIEDVQEFAARRLQSPVWAPLWWPLPSHLRFRKALAGLDELTYGAIADRRARGEDLDDVLGMLLRIKDPVTGEALSDREVRDELLTIAGAAHDTTGLTLTWAFLHLAANPQVRERVEDEVRGELRGRWPRAEDLSAFPYTHQVLQETLRLTPPIYALMRQVIQDDELDGYRVRAGSFLLTSPFMTQRHPDFWADPERFDPGRFAPDAPAPDPFAYIPFGVGPHVCIGKNFALLDTQLVVAAIASRYRLELCPDFRLDVRAGLSYRPQGPIPVRLTPAG